ncbi:hypothetical protein [Candidatus Absconditicoccus praedator]|uniref:hypothetical protein n=1 Tax=Candidatus Absconditicoccus praedator TaxID=2735562 RepID=UPI001E439AD2|nr:hypothetical protein [Candidatus Absconditicoccus praedator]UFX82766.1 hypothetical protein HLG78_01275 [Candidatus Absconditicoccus praedator]
MDADEIGSKIFGVCKACFFGEDAVCVDLNEIDFYLPDINTNIQVCYELSEENIQREVDPLLKQDGKNILVYFDKKGDFQFDGVEIVDFIDFFNNL